MPLNLIILVIFFLVAPMVFLYLSNVFPFIRKIGAALICYLVGLIVGNIGILPEGSEKIQEWITNLTIPLALPLLLFSNNCIKFHLAYLKKNPTFALNNSKMNFIQLHHHHFHTCTQASRK